MRSSSNSTQQSCPASRPPSAHRGAESRSGRRVRCPPPRRIRRALPMRRSTSGLHPTRRGNVDGLGPHSPVGWAWTTTPEASCAKGVSLRAQRPGEARQNDRCDSVLGRATRRAARYCRARSTMEVRRSHRRAGAGVPTAQPDVCPGRAAMRHCSRLRAASKARARLLGGRPSGQTRATPTRNARTGSVEPAPPSRQGAETGPRGAPGKDGRGRRAQVAAARR